MPGRKFNKSGSRGGITSKLLIFTVLTLMLVGGVFAKYVYEKNNDAPNTVVAKEFYFTSDLLTDDGKAEYILNANVNSITFTLGNNADLLRYSDDDIGYTITVMEEGSATTQASLNPSSGTIDKGKVSIVDIKLSGLQRGKTYTVTATGRAGYEKTLTASFRVSGSEEAIYKHMETSNEGYVLLTVWTQNLSGNVNISFPKGVIPDNTDEVMADVNNYGSNGYAAGSFTDTANYGNTYSSHTYRFFLDKDTAVTVNDFTVMLTDKNDPNKTATANLAEPK